MTLEIWFDFASTYSYLTVSRAEAVLSEAGLPFEWKPFLLGPIFRERGMQTSPFVLDEAKGEHMWRDLERRAMRRGLAFTRPSIFPMHSLLAARIMTAARDEPWSGTFARGVFAAQFARGEDISDQQVLSTVLNQCGAVPVEWLARAQRDSVKRELRSQTETAQAKGVFGAPSFTVGDELFWGDDRLEDAIAWARDHTS